MYKYSDKEGNTYFTNCPFLSSKYTLEWERKRRKLSTKNAPTTTFKNINLTANQVAEVKKKVGNRLKDPYSARYHSIQGVLKKTGANETSIVCGLVNAKNAFGGYVGKKPFVGYYDTRKGFSVSGMGTDSADSLSILKRCRVYGIRFDL
ncbi:hypothetical protein [Thiocystis violacea]|uniref:hypothetical protein n=1 Tax=Thiocystis violacea TaxID=13725 RepID=UPI001A91B90C|nr:hypothetical protein [Thiocystis violacea]